MQSGYKFKSTKMSIIVEETLVIDRNLHFMCVIFQQNQLAAHLVF